MIDLLLGALGGVACLVIVYLAIQNVNASANPVVKPRELAIVIESPDDCALKIGREVALMIEDSEGQKAFLSRGERTDDGTLTVRWPGWLAEAGRNYLISVGHHPDNDLQITIWVRSPGTTSDQLASWRTEDPVVVNVFWLDSPEEKASYSLQLHNSYCEKKEAPCK